MKAVRVQHLQPINCCGFVGLDYEGPTKRRVQNIHYSQLDDRPSAECNWEMAMIVFQALELVVLVFCMPHEPIKAYAFELILDRTLQVLMKQRLKKLVLRLNNWYCAVIIH